MRATRLLLVAAVARSASSYGGGGVRRGRGLGRGRGRATPRPPPRGPSDAPMDGEEEGLDTVTSELRNSGNDALYGVSPVLTALRSRRRECRVRAHRAHARDGASVREREGARGSEREGERERDRLHGPRAREQC